MDKKKTLETLRLTLQWLDNLEQQRGLELLIDMMPNNWRGRFDIQDLIDEIEGQDKKKIKLWQTWQERKAI